MNIKNTGYLWALGLHSAGIIAYQLILMQLISIMQWYHFAYMIISIAMLGFGASGTIIALFRNKLLKYYTVLVPLLMGASGIFMLLAFILARLPGFQFDVYLLFVERNQTWLLAYNYLFYFLPFFTGALAIGLMFIKNAQNIGKYYFSNLLGSGAGGLLAVVFLANILPLTALALCAGIPLAASLILWKLYEKSRWPAWVTAIATGVLVSFFLYNPGDIPISEYKSLSRTLHLPQATIIHQKPDIHGPIQVVSSPALRYAPAVSLAFTGNIPVKKNVFINAEFYGAIPQFDTTITNIHDYTTEALPYVMRARESILILNVATGNAVAHAIQNNVQNIHAIIENKTIKQMMENELADESNNLLLHPAVNVKHQISRQFLFADDALYDAIILPRMETFGGSTGLQALHENYNLTVEAFDLMWNKLTPDGVIAITSWLDYPPRTTLKIASLISETLRRQGIERPIDHLAAIRSWGTISFIVKKSPVDSMEQHNIRAFCEKRFFDPVLLPTITSEERERFNFLEDDTFLSNMDQIAREKDAPILDEYDFYIKAPTDDRPYFDRFIKPLRINALIQEHGAGDFPFLELGYLIVWITLAQSAFFAIILIILPLLRLKGKSKNKTGTLFYFGALGLGYMFAEIIFIQRFILYFGHPVYSISLVISIMLIASGAGSLYSGKIHDAGKASRTFSLITAVLLLFYGLFLTGFLTLTIHFPLMIKFIIALVLLAIPGFCMGIPFPSGIRLLQEVDSNQIAWAWGINGCLSVIATALATLISVEGGFKLVFLMASGLYVVAFLAFYRKKLVLKSN